MLESYERAFTRVCFDEHPEEDDLRALGGMRERFMLYREMVRSRLRRMLEQGLPKTTEHLGDEEYERWFTAWLATRPPGSRYIRDIVPSFCEMLEGTGELAARIRETACYERTRWELANEHVELPSAGQFAFEKRPVLNPAIRVLRLTHAVHGGGEANATHLLVYRRPDDHRVGYRVLTPMYADLVEAWIAGGGTVTDTVKAAAEAHGQPIDEALVNRLGATLADFIERGIVLGAR